MTIFIIVASALLLVATCLPLSSHPHWIIRGFDFPRLQLAFTALALLFCQLFILDLTAPFSWLLITVTVGCLMWQTWWILPYTRLWPHEVKSSKGVDDDCCFSILTSNVLTPNRGSEKLISLVRQHQPDVLVTLESDQWWEDQLSELESDMRFTIKCPLDNLYGMHVYSRLPIEEASTEYLVEDDVPSMHASIRLRCGIAARFHFLHPAPPSPTENPESAERDAELVVVARSVSTDPGPIIVTGDLNDVAWSSTTRLFRKLSGLLDPRVGRGMFNTFHVDYPFFRWPLDHLFMSKHFTLVSILRMPSIGSDHFSLLTRLAYAPVRGSDQDGLQADSDDKAWADEIAEAQDVDRSDVPTPGNDLNSVPRGKT